jgi:hypothetical protein
MPGGGVLREPPVAVVLGAPLQPFGDGRLGVVVAPLPQGQLGQRQPGVVAEGRRAQCQ